MYIPTPQGDQTNVTPKNILIIKLRYLGDVLIATPVLTTLKRHLPDASLTVLVEAGAAPLLAHNPAVDRVLTLRRPDGTVERVAHFVRLVQAMRKLHFDLVLDLTNNDRAALLAFLSGAPRRLGFGSRRGKKLWRFKLFTELVPPGPRAHVVVQQLAMTDCLGFPAARPRPSLFWDGAAEASCAAIAASRGLPLDAPFAVLHAASAARYKTWTNEGCAALIDHLRDRYGMRTALVGRGEQEMAQLQEISSLCRTSPVHLAGLLGLAELAALLARARLFVGIDSGPMHMAAAVGTPVVALFGPSRAWRWGPLGEGHTVVQKSWECVPCGKKGCGGRGISRCLEELTAAEVLAAVDAQIAQTRGTVS
jgi:heptosyltransferase III